MQSRDTSGVSKHEASTHHTAFDHVARNPESDTHDTHLSNGTELQNGFDESPSKRRKLTDADVRPRSLSRPVSPPWRRIAVEGPTSFVEGGRRKSSRTNQVPLEFQPPSEKRQTRSTNKRPKGPKSIYGGAAIISTPPAPQSSDPPKPRRGRPPGSGKVQQGQLAGKTIAGAGTPKSAPPRVNTPKSFKVPMTNSPSSIMDQPRTPTKQPTRAKESSELQPTRRSSRAFKPARKLELNGYNGERNDNKSPSVSKSPQTQRFRFKIKMPRVPVLHPGHIVGARHFSSFRDWFEHQDPLSGEDNQKLSYDDAVREAHIRQRIEEATEPGGVLSQERCAVYQPEPQEDPPKQFSHQDHLISQAMHFQRLMDRERKSHMILARKIAHAAKSEGRKILEKGKPKTAEQIERELEEQRAALYRLVCKDLQKKWGLITEEVNKRRLARWEEEEEERGKLALNKMLQHSNHLLDARLARRSSGAFSDDDSDQSDDEESASASGHRDSSNMSNSESESEEDAQIDGADNDENLTIEQLQQKYSRLSDSAFPTRSPSKSSLHDEDLEDELALPKEVSYTPRATERVAGVADVELEDVDEMLVDDSDSSTDMDEDMGDSDEGDATDEDIETEEEHESGLLGFFAPQELGDDTRPLIDTTMGDGEDDIDELSLIPGPSQTPAGPPFMQEPASTRNSLETPDSHQEPSSQASPGTNATTKASEPDSRSSIELHDSRQVSRKATPQSSSIPNIPIPSLLRGTLREYQHYGLDWLAGLYANGTNGILADEMGLGKTIQTIALLAHLACVHEAWGPHLVVVPTSVMLNWEMEFKKWCPGFKILTYYGTQEERKAKRKGWGNDDTWHVVITSYQLALQDQTSFKRRNWHYMVLDEAHNIKNFRSQRWQALLTFKTRARLLLTGTPLQNNLTELWSLLYFLMPSDMAEDGIGGFADLKEFSDWFKKPVEQILEHGRETMDNESRMIVTKLHKLLRPYLLRRLKADVEKQMPGKYEHVVYCRLSKRQRHLYDEFLSRGKTKETLAGGNYLSIMNCLMQLRKVCNHPDLHETREIVTSCRMSKSAVADFEINEFLVRRKLLREESEEKVNLDFLGLLPTSKEAESRLMLDTSDRLMEHGPLLEQCWEQKNRIYAQNAFDGSSMHSTSTYVNGTVQRSRLIALEQTYYRNALRRSHRPIYGSGLIEHLTLGLQHRPFVPKPIRRAQMSEWLTDSMSALREMIPTLAQRSIMMQSVVEKFGCITPAVYAREILPLSLTEHGMLAIQQAQSTYKEDNFHDARIRLSIAFPDKRLLQYDCGKLQRLDKLLRDLQSGGHRALIFTQMTKVLDILEQFLNIHGHRYLRLDGSTKVEQRQILTERFNNDDRILVFILSSRSGGLGINLTGADTVIFYDLDWNPAMDKQCQDRCHRIGQTRDVHIYRFVTEATIESNILRKANQKRMLDDVVIQEGEFTTEYFNKMAVPDIPDDDAEVLEGRSAANAALDRVLGGQVGGEVEKVLEQVEDTEDIVAAKKAKSELVHTDDADFDEKVVTGSGAGATPRTPGTPFEQAGQTRNVSIVPGITDDLQDAVALVNDEDDLPHVDEYMIKYMEWFLEDVPVDVPLDRLKSKSKNKKNAYRVKKHTK
ncbi:MAG: swr1 complex component [Vezdaea acicularis]|nr:MAG: swr1 complex component [Vezdaea acicularis]